MEVSVFFLHKATGTSKYLTTTTTIRGGDDLQQYSVMIPSSITSLDIMFI
jgi:hypothetical protein